MFGTGQFALPAFQALAGSTHQVVGLVTQPERTGRGHHHHENALKQAALQAGIDVFQPERAGTADALERLRGYMADLFVVAAYGQILSRALLDIPRLGAINLHASLLPRYRGAAPIQHAVMHGESRTGVTIFQIVPQLDAGPILAAVATDISPDETSGELEHRLAELAVPLTLDVVGQFERGVPQAVPQNDTLATLAPKLTKDHGRIDWSRTALEILRHLRAMQPWPMPFTFLHRDASPPLRLLVLAARAAETSATSDGDARPGGVLSTQAGRLLVRAGEGVIEVLRIQPAGKRAMTAGEFLRGHALTSADWFGSP
jgi:methionyl-tRNA formyltransferase